MKKILLTILGFIALLNAGFTTVNQVSGVVKDTNTQLQWQDDYSDNEDNIKIATWTDAIDYCEALRLDGTGWRLPNKKELESLVDYSKSTPSIDTLFNSIASNRYWSSTTGKRKTLAYVVGFKNGYVSDDYLKSGTYYVRCVR